MQNVLRKDVAHGEIQPAICFCSPRAERFYIFKWFKQRSSVLWHMKSIWNSNQFINKVLLKHSSVHLFTYWLWLLLPCSGQVLSSCDWDRMVCKAENISWPFVESLLSSLVCVCKREGVTAVMSGILGLLWSSVVNRSAKILEVVT